MKRIVLSIYLPTLYVDMYVDKNVNTAPRELAKLAKPGAEAAIADNVIENTIIEKNVIASISMKGDRYVARASRGILKAGITPGTKLSHATSLFPNAQICEYYRHVELRYLEEMATFAYRYSPICGIDELPQGIPTSASSLLNHRYVGLNIDLSGSERLLQGYNTFLRVIARQLNNRGIFARLAIAPSLGAAWALSRFSHQRCSCALAQDLRQELAPLPIQALRLLPRTEENLIAVNVRHIKDLLEIPRRSLVSRYGIEVVRRIDQALGGHEEPIRPVGYRHPLHCRHDFSTPVTEMGVIQNVSSLIVAKIVSKLSEQKQILSNFALHIKRDNAPDIEKRFAVNFPSSDIERLKKRTTLFLEQIDVAGGITSISILVISSELEHSVNMSYLPPADGDLTHQTIAGQNDSALLGGCFLDALQDRLGENSILQLQYHASYLPEKSFKYRVYIPGETNKPIATNSQTKDSDATVIHPDRPTMLFWQPEPVSVVLLAVDERNTTQKERLDERLEKTSAPRQITWRKARYRIISAIGPERISTAWWTTNDSESIARDYFHVQLNTGLWLWIFHQLSEDRWYIHGLWQ